MMQLKFEKYECDDFKEYVIFMELNARVDVNFARVDINFQAVTVT